MNAFKMVFALACTGLLCDCFVETERVVYADDDPPPERDEAIGVAPGTDYAWVHGHWQWAGDEYVWVAGYWLRRPSATSVWLPGHYRLRRHHWVWIEGHWA